MIETRSKLIFSVSSSFLQKAKKIVGFFFHQKNYEIQISTFLIQEYLMNTALCLLRYSISFHKFSKKNSLVKLQGESEEKSSYLFRLHNLGAL